MRVCQEWFRLAVGLVYEDVDFGLFVAVLGLPYIFESPEPTRRRLVGCLVLYHPLSAYLTWSCTGYSSRHHYSEVPLGEVPTSLQAYQEIIRRFSIWPTWNGS